MAAKPNLKCLIPNCQSRGFTAGGFTAGGFTAGGFTGACLRTRCDREDMTAITDLLSDMLQGLALRANFLPTLDDTRRIWRRRCRFAAFDAFQPFCVGLPDRTLGMNPRQRIADFPTDGATVVRTMWNQRSRLFRSHRSDLSCLECSARASGTLRSAARTPSAARRSAFPFNRSDLPVR